MRVVIQFPVSQIVVSKIGTHEIIAFAFTGYPLHFFKRRQIDPLVITLVRIVGPVHKRCVFYICRGHEKHDALFDIAKIFCKLFDLSDPFTAAFVDQRHGEVGSLIFPGGQIVGFVNNLPSGELLSCCGVCESSCQEDHNR